MNQSEQSAPLKIFHVHLEGKTFSFAVRLRGHDGSGYPIYVGKLVTDYKLPDHDTERSIHCAVVMKPTGMLALSVDRDLLHCERAADLAIQRQRKGYGWVYAPKDSLLNWSVFGVKQELEDYEDR